MAEHVMTGDTFGTDLPKTQISEELLTEEKNLAKYSKSKEFKEIREYWENRKTFFMSYTPSGSEIRFQVPNDDIAQMWVLANNMINEINAFLSRYDNAVDVMEQVNDVQRT